MQLYKAGAYYRQTASNPWHGTNEVSDDGTAWRQHADMPWRKFSHDGVSLAELVRKGYWESAIPPELQVSEGL